MFIDRLKLFFQKNTFLSVVFGLFILILFMTVVTLSFRNTLPPVQEGPNEMVTRFPTNEYDNSQLLEDEPIEPEVDGVLWETPSQKNFIALDLELPVQTDNFSISKLEENLYLIEINEDFPQAEQAVSMYLRQFNMKITEPEFILEFN